MKQVNIVGVPEHFNMPWHMAIDEGAFEERGIELIWTDVPEGTGKMSQLLATGETDLAIILTEGIVKSISDGNPSIILQEYIGSPLLWGIHIAAASTFNTIEDLQNAKVAISRMGSGSHLMAYVNAENNGWSTKNLQFEIINNLDGAVNYLTEKKDAYFMWEHFTTKPLVDAGIFRHLGDCPTPWPCFVIAGNRQFYNENKTIATHILEVINGYTAEFKMIPSINKTLANDYQQQLNDIDRWLAKTYWSQQQLTEEVLHQVQRKLLHLQLIDTIKPSTIFMP